MSDDDFSLFSQEMGKVTVLQDTKPRVQVKKRTNKHTILRKVEENTGFEHEIAKKSKTSVKRTEDWQLCASGVSGKALKKLAQANLKQYELDLHGLSQQQATAALEDFIGRAVQQGIRQLSIVHGRGLHSDDKPILKHTTYQWLEHSAFSAYILAAVTATHSKGGASHVLLRRLNR